MIGLIFGETEFPKKILEKIKNKKKYLIIDLTRKKKFKKNKHSYSVSIGEFGKIIEILKKNKCKKVLFAGKVAKPNFSKIKLDIKGIYYISKIISSSKIGDAAILKQVIKIFKKEKINTINSLTFTPDLTLKKGIHTKSKPTYLDKKDIKIGINKLNKINKHNFTQAVVVRNQRIIAIEGKDGTQKLLSICKNKEANKSGVLVKFPKKKQDLRIDLPTIGIKTLTQCKISGIKGIILKNKQNIFLNKKESINFANKHKMFIKVI